MKTLEEIKRQLQAGAFEFTRHAFKRAIERNISEWEIITLYEPDPIQWIDYRRRKT